MARVLARTSTAAARSCERLTTVGDFRDALYARYRSTFKEVRAEGSVAWWDARYLPLLADVDRGAPVLELGCGDGGLLAYLATRSFSRTTGIDVSAEQVAIARARGVEVVVADAFDWLAVHQDEYAAILSVDMFEHFTRDELVRLVPMLHGALRDGGRLLVQTANGAGLFPGQVIYGDLTHMSILTPESIAQLLRPFGFSQIRCFETGPIPLRLRGKLNVAVWWAVTSLARTVKYIETGKHQQIWTENFICAATRA